jgi:hypothetical protein
MLDPKGMGNCGDARHKDFDPDTTWRVEEGVGTATTLPMSDEERAAVLERPMGFIWPKGV